MNMGGRSMCALGDAQTKELEVVDVVWKVSLEACCANSWGSLVSPIVAHANRWSARVASGLGRAAQG